MITGLDHIPIVVEDLGATVAGFTALLGCPPTWRGRYPGARSAWFQLPNVALDVIAPHGEGAAGDEARARLAKYGPGATSIGWRVTDLGTSVRTLERRGLPIAGRGVTRSTADDGNERTWNLAMLRVRPTGGLPMFLVEADGARPPPLTDAEVSGLDHAVVNTAEPERTVALYGGRLGLDLRLDRTHEAFGARMLFFRCGDAVVEVVAPLDAARAPEWDAVGGLAWRVPDLEGARERCAASGLDVSEVRAGRKPGTRVFTVRNAPGQVPTLMIGPA